jgi:hypothetical protein
MAMDYLTTLSVVQPAERRIVRQLLNILEGIWKESVVDKSKVIFWHSPKGKEKPNPMDNSG